MAEDNWIHRSEHMKCRTCMWFVYKLCAVGKCRRHAPTMNGYPVVLEDDWCGDHKLDETVMARQLQEQQSIAKSLETFRVGGTGAD